MNTTTTPRGTATGTSGRSRSGILVGGLLLMAVLAARLWVRSYSVADGVILVDDDARALQAVGSVRGWVTYNIFWANRFELPRGWHVKHVEAAWILGQSGPFEQYIGRPTVVTLPHEALVMPPLAGAMGVLAIGWMRRRRGA